jgi:hypothetical protein
MINTIRSIFGCRKSKSSDTVVEEQEHVPTIDVEEKLEIELPRVIEPEDAKPNNYWSAGTGTVAGWKYTEITVTKKMIVDDPTGVGALLPSLFKLKFPVGITKAIGFMRRAHNVTYAQEKALNGMCYTVMAAPICSSAKLTVNTMCKKAARAVFIIQGCKLFYRIELVSVDAKTDTANVEHVTYDISSLLQYYCPATTATSVSFY